jgi:hypothetical protein
VFGDAARPLPLNALGVRACPGVGVGVGVSESPAPEEEASFFLNSFPKRLRLPCGVPGVPGACCSSGSCADNEREWCECALLDASDACEALGSGVPERLPPPPPPLPGTARLAPVLIPLMLGLPPTVRVENPEPGGASPLVGAPPPAYTSTGSNTARSSISIPRFVNLAIFASVPASTMIFVMTLCACKLYKGTIMRRLLAVEDVLVVLLEEYVEEALERLDAVRVRGAPDSYAPPFTGVVGRSTGVDGAEALRSRDCREALVRPEGPRELGGTSCTWRFSG